MAVTAETFMRARQEFVPAGEALVAETLAEAATRLSSESWGNSYDNALSLMTAHLLWSSPFGAGMRLDGGGEATTSRYLQELERLRVERIPRIMVLR